MNGTMNIIQPSSIINVNTSDRYDLCLESIEGLAELQEFITMDNDYTIHYDMRKCEYISPAFAVVFGAMPLYRASKFRKEIKYLIGDKTTSDRFFVNHGINEFYYRRSARKPDIDVTPDIKAIKFQQVTDDEQAIELIKTILDRAPIHLDNAAKDWMIQNIFEIFANALTHSKSIIGVYVSGYWETDADRFIFSVYDCGIGICQNVNSFLAQKGSQKLGSIDALKWAFIDGNTTTDLVYPRGLGLRRLEKFVELNQGDLFLATNNCVYYNNAGSYKYHEMSKSICGTLLTVCIKTDRHIYTVSRR